MQKTSQTYKRILNQPNHWFETSVVIGGDGVLIDEDGSSVTFGGTEITIGSSSPRYGFREDSLFGINTQSALFNADMPTVGSCVASELEIEMVRPKAEIPTAGLIAPFVRVTNGTEYSEWLPKGVFYIDTREVSKQTGKIDVLTLHAYDSMLKAERMYPEPYEQRINWSRLHIDSAIEQKEFSKAEYPEITKYFDKLIGTKLTYVCGKSGMMTGTNPVGAIQWFDGESAVSEVIASGQEFTVTEAIAQSTKLVVYGSTSGAAVYDYTFSTDIEEIDAVSMVMTIVNQLNEDIDTESGDETAKELRHIKLAQEDKDKLMRVIEEDGQKIARGAYKFPTIASTYSCREVLSMIAAAYGGNWYIDDANYLRLWLIDSLFESPYLSDGYGYAITFGGERINV